MKTLVAPTFILEPQRAAHSREMFGVLSDTAIYEFENEPPESEDWLRDRFSRLESGGPPDGSEKWLNWVIRVAVDELAGYVQATILPTGMAYIGYELNSRYWRQGIGGTAVSAVLTELQTEYNVTMFFAVLKAKNYRSKALLLKLGFDFASEAVAELHRDEQDEVVMLKSAA